MELYFLALLMLLMLVALGSGYPVAFALPGSAAMAISAAAIAGWLLAGDVGMFFAHGGPGEWLSAGVTNLRGVYWEPDRDTLIAIPLFIFMGIMLQRSKIAEDLLVTMAQLFGPIPGGLGISVVFVGALLAATTGIVGATVVAMGLISLPAMLRNGYSKPLATGTIAASGTLGQIIPPSIVLIILADQLSSAVDQASTLRKALYKAATGEISMPSEYGVSSTSAGEMFLGAFVPGILLVLIYMAFILVIALLRPRLAPAVPYEGARDRVFWGNVFVTLVPPLTLIFLVLGSIIAGIATVNQAGAIGAAGAMVMAGYRLHSKPRGAYVPAILGLISLGLITWVLANYHVNIKAINTPEDQQGVMLASIGAVGLLLSIAWSGLRVLRIDNTLYGVMMETAKTTSLVFIILLGAAMLTAAFRAFGGEDIVRNFLITLPGGFWTQFIIVMAVIFVLGFFLDFIEIAVVVVPIVAPILLADPSANVTAVWLGVMIGLNIQTSFLTPPFGFALFYLRGVAPAEVRTVQIYAGVVAFIVLQLAALGIVGNFPSLVNYLPNRVALTADTAPPPRNPNLQLCLEDYVHEQLGAEGGALTAAIKTVRGVDLSMLPEKLAEGVTDSFDSAEEAMTKLKEAFDAHGVVVTASPDYRPIHTDVRAIQKDMRRLDERIRGMKVDLRRIRDDDEAKAALQARIDELTERHDALAATIPAEWEDRQGAFNELTKAENTARNLYRRGADSAYEPIAELLATLRGTDALAAFEQPLDDLRSKVAAGPSQETIDAAAALSRDIRAIEGARPIGTLINDARKALRGRNANIEEALAKMDAAIAEFDAQMDWRRKAESALTKPLETYDAVLRDSLGIRSQQRLTHDQALYVAACNAHHRDISLSF